MNKKTKKILFTCLFGLDMAATLFLFIISIIMIATMPNLPIEDYADNFIGYLQENTTVFLFAVVVPLFLLLGLNIAGLFLYVKKTSKKKKNVSIDDLSAEQLEALKAELTQDLSKDKKEDEKADE